MTDKTSRAKQRAKREGTSFAEAYLLDRTDDLVRDEGLPYRQAYMQTCRTYSAIAQQARTFKELDISHLTADQKLERLRNLANDVREDWGEATGETLPAEETE